MSYARAGGWTIDGELRITAAIAHGLETLIDRHIERFGGKDEQDDEALKTIAAVVADRLEDMAADAAENYSGDYVEMQRLAAVGREAELDRKFRQEERAAVQDAGATPADNTRSSRRAKAPAA